MSQNQIQNNAARDAGQINEEIAAKIESGMKPFECCASAKEGYIRVWNCYCGSIMGGYNKQLDAVCAALGMKWTRKQTSFFGGCDWEDQARFI